MVGEGDRVLVAVSGGPDSVFLLHILSAFKRKLGISICVAHMDHGIRGAESRRDAEFVRNLSKSFGAKFTSERLRAGKINRGISLEEALREKRYGFFRKAAARSGADAVATAHTLDDQAETVLMRIIKGASLKGVVGIHPVRREKRLRFIRPLIETEKRDVIGDLKKRKIPFRIDRTNLENKFLRNRVRNRILPYLAKTNPRIKRALSNLAESLREDFEFIEGETRKKRDLLKRGKHLYYIALRDILLQPRGLRKEIMREALKLVGGNIKKLTFRHWQDVDFFLRAKARGKLLDLPGGVRIKRTEERLIFLK